MFAKIVKYKKFIIPAVFILMITAIFCSCLFSNQFYNGHDARFHMNRIIGIVEALQDHQFPPRIYPYTNNGYGYASPLFYCDLFLYPFAILYYLGLPLVITYKVMIVFYSLLTAIITFLVFGKIFRQNRITVYFCTIAYYCCNYRLYTVFARAAFGEILAMCFMPLIIYAVYKIFILKENSFVMLGISFSLVLMSHNITFIMTCAMFGIFTVYFFIVNFKDQDELKRLSIVIVKGVGVALLLTAWYLFPMLEQMLDQKFQINYLSEMYDLKLRVSNISNLLNPFINLDDDNLYTIINIGSPLLISLALYLFVAKNRYISFLACVSFIGIMCVCGVIPIYYLSQLNFIQFLIRIYIIIIPLLTLVCGYVVDCLLANNKTLVKTVFFVICIYSITNVIILDYSIYAEKDTIISDNITREELYDFSLEKSHRDHNGLEISAGEYLPITEIVDYLEETTFIKEITDDGYLDIIYDYDRQFTKISFTYDNPDGRKLIMLPQTYYKGYQAYEVVDGKEMPIETINEPTYKKVAFYVDEGLHTYTSRYVGTAVQKISLAVSLVSVLGLVAIEGKKYWKKWF